jgi:gliding motility-associated-like protein
MKAIISRIGASLKCSNQTLSLFSVILVSINMALAQPSNDNPCNATPLTAGAECSYTAGTLNQATLTTGVSWPSCYSTLFTLNRDVWYSVVVPSSGLLNINTSAGTLTDGVMAVYTGTCTSLTEIACNDDENGLMPGLSLSGLTPGSTIFIRIWRYAGGNGTFSICAVNPPPMPSCSGNPPAGNDCANAPFICDLNGYCGSTSASYTANSWPELDAAFCSGIQNNSFLKFVASATTVSFNLWITSSSLGLGIQFFIFSATNCTGPVTAYTCYNPGTVPTAQPTTISATGLTIGNTYYIMLDGYATDVCNYVIGANSGISVPVSLSPVTASVCPGQTVNLAATGGNGTYTWTPAAGLSATTGSNVTVTPPTTPGNYTYTVNSTTGNPLCPSSTTATTTITVNALPTVTAGSYPPVCSNVSSVALVGTPSGGTFTGTGVSGTNFSTSAGTQTVTYNYTNANGCSGSNTATITVNGLPTVNAGSYPAVCSDVNTVALVGSPSGGTFTGTGVTGTNFSTSAGTQTINYNYTDANGCSGSNATTITVNPLPTVSAGSYPGVCSNVVSVPLTGTPSGGTFSGTGVTGTNFSTSSGTQTITYSYTNAIGCSASNSTTINVNPLPTVSAGAYPNVCSDVNTVTLVGSPSGGTFTGTGVTGTNFATSAGTQNVTYSYTDANGCSGTNETTITVNPLPTVNAGSYPAVCSDVTSVALVGTPSGGTFTGTGVTGTNFSTASGTQNVTYNYTDANGCSGMSAATITVNALPIVNAGSYTAVCSDVSTVALVGTPSGGTFTGTGVTGTNFATSAGTQNVTYNYTDANGCAGSNVSTIIVNPLPAVDAGANQSVCLGTQVTLTGSNADSYTWSPAITDGVPFTPPVGTTIYTVTGVSSNGCVNSDQVEVTMNNSLIVSAGSYPPVCSDIASVTLVGTPSGGTFTGTGVTGTNFATSAGSQTVTYSYTDGNGCTGSSTANITVNALPNVIGGSDVSVCATQSITLTATGATSYTWSPAATNGVAFNPVSSGIYTVTGADENGCTNTAQVAVTVNPLPTVNPGQNQFVCLGTQVTLTASGASTYSWSPSISNGIPFTPPVGTTEYTVTGTLNGCENTATVQVTSNSSPTVSAGSYAAVCIDASPITLVGTPAGGTFTGVGVTGTSFNPSSGTQDVTYNYSDANGCSGSATSTITVNSLPAVDAGAYNPLCADAPNLSLVGAPAGGTFSGNGVTANDFDPSVGTQTVTYTFTNANGCVNTDVATITVVQLTPANAGSYSPVCIDAANVVLTGSPAGGTFSGTGVTAGLFDPSAGTQTVTYTYSDAIGCTTSATATILVNPLPNVGAGVSQVICEGATVTLNGTGAANYTWSGGALNGQAFTPTVGQNSYTVSGTDVNGCVSTANVNINVLPFPIALVTSDVQTGNPVLDVNFTNGSQFGTTYNWDFGNGNVYTSNLTDATSASYANPGTYVVTLIASNGLCSSVDSLEINVVPLGDPVVIVPNVFSPNDDDANDLFFLTHFNTDKIYIVILNRWGNVVFETTDTDPKWDGSAQNGQQVTDGVYFYKYVATGVNGIEIKGHGDITVVR